MAPVAEQPWSGIAARVAAATGAPFQVREARPVGGGCINEAWRLVGADGRSLFAKLNAPDREDMFAAEAAGLREIAATGTVTAPAPICHGALQGRSFLVLEYIPFGRGDASERLGRELAQMHRSSWSSYGWWRDNTIGSTPQINTPADDWVDFWRERRLGYQLRLARDNGYGGELQRRGEQLLELFPALFTGYTPAISLLHGDLWSGNVGVSDSGDPVIFDPATYYGDREAEIAMTELFGGFSSRFYAAYNEQWPLDEGYRVRRDLYNLYHILNHLNLFGGGYLRQAEQMLGRLLSELR